MLIVDPESLRASIASRIQEILRAERIAILQRDESKGRYGAVYVSGLKKESTSSIQVPMQGRLARWLRINGTCMVLEQTPGMLEYLGDEERELMERMGFQICVPLTSLDRLSGIVLLGEPVDRAGIGRDQMELLLLLASQAGLALENAGLYEEQRKRLRRMHQAERLATAGRLAAGVAHEIRNPLAAIRSTMQYIHDGLDSKDPKRDLARELLSEVDRIDRTVNDLLHLARTKELRLEPIDLREPLEQSLKLVVNEAKNAGVSLNKLLPMSPLPIMGAPDQLKEVFINLLLNAIQAMPEGGSLRVEARSIPNGLLSNGQAETKVIDSGKGIEPGHLEHVFDPFFTTKSGGTGLGLATCHGIVQAHQGEIELHSQPGQGTKAIVRFPLR